MSMRSWKPVCFFILLAISARGTHALTPSRTYVWDFFSGNLIGNWSFENRMQTWDSAAKDSPAFTVNPRFAGSGICTGCDAVTGTYVARVTGYSTVAAPQSRLYSEPFPILPSTGYVLSFYVRSASMVGTTHPVIRFFSDRGTVKIDSATGNDYGSFSNWTFVSQTFSTPAAAQYAQVVLAQSAGSGFGGTFHFDDIVLEEGTLPSSRAHIGESIAFANALQGLQNHERVSVRLPGGDAPSCLDSLTLHSLQSTDIRDQNTIDNSLVQGIVSSNTALTLGANSLMFGNVRSGGTVFLRSYSLVNGNVRAGGAVTQQAGSQVTGTITQNVSVPSCAIPAKTVPYGTLDINVDGGQVLTLQPGAYRDIHLGANADITLLSGVYNVKSFFLEPDVKIRIHLSGSILDFKVQDNIRLGDRMKMSFLQEADVFATRFYSNQTTQLYVGTDARIFGTFTAPAGNITLSPRDTLTGALYASSLTVEAGCRIAPPASKGALRSKYRVAGSDYDSFARPFISPLPIAVAEDTVRYLDDLLPRANAFFNGDSGRPDAHGRAFSETRYAVEPSPRPVESSSPDTAWRMGGNHTNRNDYRFVSDFSIPANIETPAASSQEAPFRMEWARNADSGFTLTWYNRLGQSVRLARNMNRNGADASAWSWSITTFEYYPQGGLKRVSVNRDDGLPETTEYNSMGQATSTYTKSTGLTRLYYNRGGKLRFMQDSTQRPDKYTYIEYDDKNRVLSQGVQTLSSLTQDQIDLDILAAGTKSEKIGFIYDDLSTFQARTGIALATVLPATDTLHQGFGRLVCAYNRNSDNTTPGFTALDKFVADFYDYDRRANRVRQFQYLGPIRKSGRKLQQIVNAFDPMGRVASSTIFKSANSTAAVGEHSFEYDLMGRMTSVTGLAGKPLAAYTYNDYGPLKSVLLGGNATGFSGTEVDYGYHSNGWIKSMEALRAGQGTLSWQQRLGYETSSYPAGAVPAPIRPKFDGRISQQLYQYSSDISGLKPVRLVNYAFDPMDRMLTAMGYKNSNANPLDASGRIDFSGLVLDTAGDITSRLEYDEAGRITGQRSRGVSSADSARYGYQSNSFALDHIDGKVTTAFPRNLSPSGTFSYDGRGNLVNDKSKNLTIAYGWDNRPLRFEVATGTSTGTHEFQFYDAEGRRVSKLTVAKTGSSTFVLSQGKHYVTMGGPTIKEWYETYGSGGAVTDSAEILPLYGQTPIGRITSSGSYQFFLKNHQGSVMKTVDDLGGEPAGGGNSYDYLAYGDLLKLKETGTTVTQKYTGKEYEELYRLYAFGLRVYDPEIGMWTSPDPAGQFHNPYVFGPGDPLDFVDAYGLWSLGLGLVIGYDGHGWHVGFGAAADVDLGVVDVNVDASHTWSTDGSQTSTIALGAGAQLGVIGVNGGVGGSYNTMDGYTLNVHVGANIVAVGAEVGSNQAWSTSGNYLGGNVYGEAYLGSKGIASIGGGYEAGWGAFRSGFYSNATLLMNNWSDHGHGWGYDGFQQTFNVASYTSQGTKNKAKLLTEQDDKHDKIGHSAIVGTYEGEDFHISFGPAPGYGKPATATSILAYLVGFRGGTNDWNTHEGEDHTRETALEGINIGRLYQYSEFLGFVSKVLPYNAILSSCSTHTSLALLYAGGFNTGIHPYIIEAEMNAHSATQF